MTFSNFSPVNTENRKTLDIRAGDSVRVHQKIQEKGKTRIQIFEGLCLARKHGSEPGATFTIRRVASGVGVEKVFPLYSPIIDKIEITKRSKVRRAKLYYIRDKVAREIKRQMRRMQILNIVSSDETEPEADEDVEQAQAQAQDSQLDPEQVTDAELLEAEQADVASEDDDRKSESNKIAKDEVKNAEIKEGEKPTNTDSETDSESAEVKKS